MYRAMRMARTFEQKLSALYRQGKIVGAVYLGMGQEAIATGVVSLLQKDDYFSTVARGLAGWFMRGVEPKHVLARWLGKDIPPSHGRELGLFLADLEQYGIAPYHNGSMASWIPSGAGFALAFKYRREPRVYAAMTGDGATSPGDFYEGLNFAAIHKLPLVVIVENNCFAYSTPTNLQMPVANVADRAPAFNIPAEIGFGNDIFEVRVWRARRSITREAARAPISSSSRPSGSAATASTTTWPTCHADLREFWERRDPIRLFQEYLDGEGAVPAEDLAAVDAECRTVVEEAVPYAEGAARARSVHRSRTGCLPNERSHVSRGHF